MDSATVTERGLQYDRRWMLVDDQNRFMTQRETPSMALLQVGLVNQVLQVEHKQNSSCISLPLLPPSDERIVVTIWNDVCEAQLVSAQADEWFSDMLSTSCRLVYMPEDSRREVDPHYAKQKEITSFSDAYPMLMIGQSSLDDLNSRLLQPLPINRFRPNIVFTGGDPYEEDRMENFYIGGIEFFGVKPCARCTVTTIDQETATKGDEPLRTMARYRARNNKVLFGQNLLHRGEGMLRTGDEIRIVKEKTAGLFD